VAQTFGFNRKTPGLAIRHPRYPRAKNAKTQAELRSELHIPHSELVLVFVGSIARYKRIDKLIAATLDCAPSRISLIIAGRIRDHALAQELVAQIGSCQHIQFYPRRISDEEFESFVRASDYVALPLDDILHSSSIVHALSLGRPVLTAATPYACELADLVGVQWVRVFEGALTSNTLLDLPQPPHGDPDLSALDEAVIGKSLKDFYYELLGRGRWSVATNGGVSHD
jgi:glycosyltransferase involved in cell wall biosynthesis